MPIVVDVLYTILVISVASYINYRGVKEISKSIHTIYAKIRYVHRVQFDDVCVAIFTIIAYAILFGVEVTAILWLP